MEERYRKMSKLGVRNIDGYNMRAEEAQKKGAEFFPFLQMWWARCLAIHPALIPLVPTTTINPMTGNPQIDGGFMVNLAQLPWERVVISHALGHPCLKKVSLSFSPTQ